GRERNRVVIAFKATVDENAAAILGVVPVLLECFGENDDLDAAGGIIEREDAHPVAFACLQRTEAGHDAADGDVFGDPDGARSGSTFRLCARFSGPIVTF